MNDPWARDVDAVVNKLEKCIAPEWRRAVNILFVDYIVSHPDVKARFDSTQPERLAIVDEFVSLLSGMLIK